MINMSKNQFKLLSAHSLSRPSATAGRESKHARRYPAPSPSPPIPFVSARVPQPHTSMTIIPTRAE